MEAKKLNFVRFAPHGKDSFFEGVKSKVHSYFKANNLSPYANKAMWLKTGMLLALYFVPYAFLVTGIAAPSLWLFIPFGVLMAFDLIGIGTCIMHDANHGTYSAKKSK